LRCPGVTRTAPIKFTRSLCSRLVRRVGVCPRGAHVRFRGETKEKPVSSTKTRVAWRSRQFFYPWPRMPLPMDHGLFVACQTAPLGLLGTPAQALHQIPDTARSIAHAKHLPNHLPDPIKGPVVFRIAPRIGSALQHTDESPKLRGRQTTRPARRTSATLPLGLFGLPAPSAHALRSGSNPLRHFGWTQFTA